MELTRSKRHSAEGWKYVNSDGSLWPADHWIPYSKKHPRPVAVDTAPPPWNQRPDPVERRIKIPADQWAGKEDGGFYAYVLPVSTSVFRLKDDRQKVLTEYFAKKINPEV